MRRDRDRNGTLVGKRYHPKTGTAADYPQGYGPQGDAIRIYNYVRLVRDTGTMVGGEGCDSVCRLEGNPVAKATRAVLAALSPESLVSPICRGDGASGGPKTCRANPPLEHCASDAPKLGQELPCLGDASGASATGNQWISLPYPRVTGAPSAVASNWLPRQMPRTGLSAWSVCSKSRSASFKNG